MIVAEGFNVHTFANAFRFCWDDRSFVATKSLEHIELSRSHLVIAIVIALPLGVWLGHLHRGSFLAINVSNLGRALPSLAVISSASRPSGIGSHRVILALVVLAAPLILTNSFVGVDPVEAGVVEAARGWASRRCRCSRASSFRSPCRSSSRDPHGCGLRRRDRDAGGFVGGAALGDIIFNQATYFLSGVVGAAMVVSFLASSAFFLFAGLQRLLTPRGLRHAEAAHMGEEPATA